MIASQLLLSVLILYTTVHNANDADHDDQRPLEEADKLFFAETASILEAQ